MAIQLCDGVKTAKQIVTILSRAFADEVKDEQAGYDLLDQLRARYFIQWSLDVPVELNPERVVRAALLRVEDEALRCTALGALDELDKHRAAVAQASGDAERLDQAMAEMEAYFIRVSGQTATRSAGEMYAARTLVYEDCRRDVEIELGPEFLRHLGPPLSLLLHAGRWYTFETAKFYRAAFARLYKDLVKSQGSNEVDAVSFWSQAQPLVLHGDQNAAKLLAPEFQRRWAEILSLPEGQNRVHYTVEQLRPLVLEKFDVPKAGWSIACYHSPDVMVAATGPDAIKRGEYDLVLGEFHLGSNTLRGALFVAQHPKPEELFQACESDMPHEGLRMCPPKHWPGLTSRTSAYLIPRSHSCWIVSHDAVRPAEPRKTYEIGSLFIVEEEGQLLLKSRDGSLSCDIIEAFADAFHLQMINQFKLVQPKDHTPRITIDRLVVARESWRIPPEEFSFAYVKDDASRFLAARRWAQERGMPRYVFAKSPVETKPVYVDFASPIYTNIFAKIIRRTAEFDLNNKRISVSEMLPAHDELWLDDSAGQHYTSEFRIVAVCH
ncbi:MAG TPA: lantibiotic dehydratase, partial [Pyrinomonadaceae bacterium]